MVRRAMLTRRVLVLDWRESMRESPASRVDLSPRLTRPVATASEPRLTP